MGDTGLFSVAVDQLLCTVKPNGRSVSAFPPRLDEQTARKKAGETLDKWFIRMVDLFCDGDPKTWAIEDNIAIFMRLSWGPKERLVYANVQTIVAACDLEDYYLGMKAEAQYLRLDFDYKSLGDPFSHPLAHIHVEGDLSPRFALEGGNAGNIVVDYLEFLYRNYVPFKWLKWVEREWRQEFAATPKSGDVDRFPMIVEAFATGQFQILRDHAPLLTRIKQTLRRRKDAAFAQHVDGFDREILEYPLARQG
jgi:hypothetical protein